MRTLCRSILSFLLIFFTISCSNNYYETTFHYEPDVPDGGDEVTVYYNPAETKLKDAKEIELIAYAFNDKLLETTGVTLTKEEKGFYGKFIVHPDAVGILVKFTTENPSLTDNNNEGYLITVNKEEVSAGYAAALGSWIYNLDIDQDQIKAIEKFKEVFTESPKLLGKYADRYFNSVWRGDIENRNSVIGENLSALEKDNKDPKDQNLLITFTRWYGRIGDSVKADLYKSVLNKNFPNNQIAEDEEFQIIREEIDLNKKLDMVNEFIKRFNESKQKQDLYYYVLEDFRKQDRIVDALEIISKNPRQPNPYIFTKLFNSSMEKNDYSTALKIAVMEVDVTKNESEKPIRIQPENMTSKEWQKSLNQEYGYALYHLSQAQYKTGDKATALENAKTAADLTSNEDLDVNLFYVKLLKENDNATEAIEKIKKLVIAGKANNEMKGILKDLFIPALGNKESLSLLLKDLEKQALAGLITKLKSEIINEPAPGFTLKNLDGKAVSLDELKGKIVIIDFWATWCGPCRQSFPGMQIAVERFKENKNVEFLFINTWERVADKLTNAKEFIKNNKYPFNVLMDTENSVIASYKVSGIPTKFVVDGDGNIRFKVIGFDGNTDHVADEISAMVNLISEL
ncbi:MAG: TlpA family protein disulfide reductase [Bacteroidetes bacterium]|nr:TlpA family protein disulfide reductase [Bacteroidota bacterium]